MAAAVVVTHPVIERRRREQAELLARARSFATQLDPALGVSAVVVFGSVARGDFNLWSDVDVLVIAEHLPDRWLDRLAAVGDDAPPRVAPIAWTPQEFRRKLGAGDPIAAECLRNGVVVAGALHEPHA